MTPPTDPFLYFLFLLFSTAGATIVVCLTIIIVALIFVIFFRRFSGMKLGSKLINVELPDHRGLPSPAKKEASLETAPPKELEHKLPQEELPANGDSLSTSETQSEVASQPSTKEPTLISYYIKMLDGAEAKDRQAIEAAVSDIGKHKDNKLSEAELETMKQYQFLEAGFSGALESLIALDEKHGGSTQAARNLANHYLGLRAVEQAAKYIDKVNGYAKSDSEKASGFILSSSLIKIREGSLAAANYLKSKASGLTNVDSLAMLWGEAADLFDDAGEKSETLLAFENSLRFDPTNKHRRFRLAYTYGETAAKLLSFHHYNILLRQDAKYSSVTNNLGLLYGELGLKSEKINLFLRGRNNDESWASGNLAQAYLDAGFVSEAQRVIDGLKPEIAGEQRVARVRSAIVETQESDNRKKDEFIKVADELSGELTNWKFLPVPLSAFLGKWINNESQSTLALTSGSSGDVKIEIKSGNSIISGSTKQSAGVISLSGTEKTDGASGLMSYWSREGTLILLTGADVIKVIYLNSSHKIEFKRVFVRSGDKDQATTSP